MPNLRSFWTDSVFLEMESEFYSLNLLHEWGFFWQETVSSEQFTINYLFFPQHHWDIINTWRCCVSLTWAMCWFHTLIYWKMITAVGLWLTPPSPPLITNSFLRFEHLSCCSLSYFQGYNTGLLTIITLPYINYPELIPLRPEVYTLGPTLTS